ncbi:MAG TPA: sigma factor-like helix-turn-helix DNA-binding protein [Pirellulaceae bacterium]|nr:sigma factor-like helix-turn-helix DNA-binding protein [Pirellulaceae bacterium]
MADDLGVSKERVRQLERRAFEKLQALASQVDLDRFVEASCA